MKDLYETLGVDKKASKEEIKKAYRKKAKDKHPDAGGGNEEFTALARAYDILSDEEKRKRYDETGETEPDKISPIERIKYDLMNEIVAKCPSDYKYFLNGKLEALTAQNEIMVSPVIEKKKKLEEFIKRIKKYPEKNPVNIFLIANNQLRNYDREIENHEKTLNNVTQAIDELIKEYEIDKKEETTYGYGMTGRFIFGRGI